MLQALRREFYRTKILMIATWLVSGIFRYLALLLLSFILSVLYLQSEQKIAAIIVINQTKKVNIENILEWCSENMDESEIPTIFKLVTAIARDSSGHVDKLKIKNLFNDEPLLCFYDSKLWSETGGENAEEEYIKDEDVEEENVEKQGTQHNTQNLQAMHKTSLIGCGKGSFQSFKRTTLVHT